MTVGSSKTSKTFTWGDKVKWWDIVPNKLEPKGIREFGVIRFMNDAGYAFIETTKGEFMQVRIDKLERWE